MITNVKIIDKTITLIIVDNKNLALLGKFTRSVYEDWLELLLKIGTARVDAVFISKFSD